MAFYILYFLSEVHRQLRKTGTVVFRFFLFFAAIGIFYEEFRSLYAAFQQLHADDGGTQLRLHSEALHSFRFADAFLVPFFLQLFEKRHDFLLTDTILLFQCQW